MEGWPTPCWVPRGSDKAPLEEVVAKKILEEIRDTLQKEHVVEETFEVILDVSRKLR